MMIYGNANLIAALSQPGPRRNRPLPIVRARNRPPTPRPPTQPGNGLRPGLVVIPKAALDALRIKAAEEAFYAYLVGNGGQR